MQAFYRLAGAALLLAASAATPNIHAGETTLPNYAPDTTAAGTLRVSGADTMYALMDSWSTQFTSFQPLASVVTDHAATLSAHGFEDLLQGKADLVTFVREPFSAELAAFQSRFGYPLTTVRIAGGSYATKGGTHAIAIYVHASNPLSRLTMAQLDAAFSSSLLRGAARQALTWGDLGLQGEWRDRPIHVYGMLGRRESGNPPGIVNYMTQRVLRGGTWRSDVREQRDRDGESALAGVVARVSADPEGIGYSGFGYRQPGTKTLALAEETGLAYYSGTPDEVARQDYPLSRSIYLGLNAPPGKPLPALTASFLRFVLSAEGQRTITQDHMHFIALDAAQAAQARQALPR